MFKFRNFFLFLTIFIFLFCPYFLIKAKNIEADVVFDSNQIKNQVEVENAENESVDDQKDDVSVRNISSIYLDKNTILKGYTVGAFDNYLKLSLVPGILDNDTEVLIEKISDTEMTFPWMLKKISSVVQFEFVNKKADRKSVV